MQLKEARLYLDYTAHGGREGMAVAGSTWQYQCMAASHIVQQRGSRERVLVFCSLSPFLCCSASPAMEQGGSSYLNQPILENPSQSYPEACFRGESRCCQVVNQYGPSQYGRERALGLASLVLLLDPACQRWSFNNICCLFLELLWLCRLLHTPGC